MNLRKFFAGVAMLVPTVGMAAENTTIPEIQGSGHVSPLDGKIVRFVGVVTQLREKSFFVQDPAGDGNDLTSDGILVSRSPTGLAPGDMVRVEGLVDEQGQFGDFSTTAITKLIFTKIGQGQVPRPVVIGGGGRLPPTEAVVSTAKIFDPTRSGADFIETLEGMWVEIASPVVVGPMMKKEKNFFVVADNGRQATGMNSLGGISSTPGDQNPERLRVQIATPLTPTNYQVGLGDHFSVLRGSVITDGSSYGIQLAESADYTPKVWVTQPFGSQPAANVLTVASYNVENLDVRKEDAAKVPSNDEIDDDVAEGKFVTIAKHIVGELGGPDIVALQEVQDNDGGEYSDDVAAEETLKALTDAIVAAGGPQYEVVSLDPVDDREGGQPGANIRCAFLFNPARVATDRSLSRRIADPAFERTRLPLATPFIFAGKEVWLINVHYSSKSGSDSAYVTTQPPKDTTIVARTEQARAVKAFVRGLQSDPKRSILIVGDFNSLWNEEPMTVLTGGDPGMTNLAMASPSVERISYVYEGNSQSLDHAVALLGTNQSATLDTLHVNSVMPESKQTSDHDPKFIKLTFN